MGDETMIDYARMNREHKRQKAALTRAINSGDPRKVMNAARKAVREWNEIGAWPDDWSRWQRAIDDAYPAHQRISLNDI